MLLNYLPLTLILGVGNGYDLQDVYGDLAEVDNFGILLERDRYDASDRRPNYIKLSLTDPENLHLFGFQVHALLSVLVFTYDGAGVIFNDLQEADAAKRLDAMLWPGGIMVNDNIGNTRLETILRNKFGYKQVYARNHRIEYIQKPF